MATKEEVSEKLSAFGFSACDADALADCFVSNKSLSWVNTDVVSKDMLQKLGVFMKENHYQLKVSVQEVPTRGKYIWDVEGGD